MVKKLLRQMVSRPLPVLPSAEQALLARYQQKVAQQHIQYDSAQIEVLDALQQLVDYLQLRQHYASLTTAQKLFLAPLPAARHVYLHGKVGGGKSMLLELFYSACPLEKKRRVHFHAFMQETHSRLHELRQIDPPDLVLELARELAASVEVLCFDEFLVQDITDAMLLGRLFKQLFELGVVMVATSNFAPQRLYWQGLQREQFLPFIYLLEQTTDIVELCNTQDYRLQHLLTFRQRYYFPLNEYADYLIHQSYSTLTNDAPKRPGVIQVRGRSVPLTAVHGDVVLSSFEELCVQPLGAGDYLQLALQFSTVILADIPELTANLRNEALRFCHLIDVLYEHQVKLICSAAAPAEALYAMEEGAFEFQRTVSRLVEMQSEAYLQKSWLQGS